MSIASEIARLQAAKESLKFALEQKGAVIPEGLTLEDYYGYVEDIAQGGMAWTNGMKCAYWSQQAINATDWASFPGFPDMTYMFAYCTGLTTFSLTNLSTSTATNLNNLFLRCTNLVSVDLSGWNTSNVTACSDLFYYDSKLVSVNLNGWNLSRATNFKFGSNTTLLANVTGTITGLGNQQSTIDLTGSPALTRDSIVNLMSALVVKSSGVHTMRLHAEARARLSTSDMMIATAKGWTIS